MSMNTNTFFKKPDTTRAPKEGVNFVVHEKGDLQLVVAVTEQCEAPMLTPEQAQEKLVQRDPNIQMYGNMTMEARPADRTMFYYDETAGVKRKFGELSIPLSAGGAASGTIYWMKDDASVGVHQVSATPKDKEQCQKLVGGLTCRRFKLVRRPPGAAQCHAIEHASELSERVDEVEHATFDNHEPRILKLEKKVNELSINPAAASVAGGSQPALDDMQTRVLQALHESVGAPVDKLELRDALVSRVDGTRPRAAEVNQALYALHALGRAGHDTSQRPKWSLRL